MDADWGLTDVTEACSTPGIIGCHQCRLMQISRGNVHLAATCSGEALFPAGNSYCEPWSFSL